MQKKRFRAAMMAAAMALSGLTAMATSSGKCGDNLTWTLDDDGALVVTGTGEMYDYDDEKNEKWDKSLIRHIEIGPGVTTIGTYAFSYAKQMAKITLHDSSLSTIGDFAFMGCSGLKSVYIPDCVNAVKQYAFGSCKALEDVTIGTSVSDLGLGAFSQCGVVKSITVRDGNATFDSRDGCNAIIHTATNEMVRGCQTTVIPNTVTTIGTSAFSDIQGMEYVYIPNSVTKIGQFAFGDCKDLKTATIGNSVATIGRYAFMNCHFLERVTIGSSVSTIDDSAFPNCYRLAIIVFKTTTPPACGSKLFSNVDTGTCRLVVPAESADQYKAADTWKDFANIKTIDASGKCGKNLEWTLDSDGELAITGDGPMYDYTISYHPGWHDKPIKTAYIEARTSNIGSNAFYGYEQLTNVKIPNSVAKIGEYAFRRCYKLTDVVLPDNLTDIGQYAFDACSSLKSMAIPKSVKSIGAKALGHCYNIESIEVEEGNTEYDSRDNCNAVIHTSTNELVAGCKNTVIPNTVAAIGKAAFDGCYELTNIDIPTSVVSIGAEAFGDCRKLTGIVLPPSLTAIGFYTFAGCHSFESITIPDKVVSIGVNAFSGCTELKDISIGSSVATIGSHAFNRCNKLEVISVNAATPPECSTAGVFGEVDKETCRLIVPQESIELYKSAFEWKDFKNIGLGIGEVSADNGVAVSVSRRTITVTGVDADATTEIYTISGIQVYSGPAGTATMPISGVYIVRVTGKTFKAAVR